MQSHSSSGSFGDDGQRFRDLWQRRTRPQNQIPVTVGTSILLGRTDELAVAVSDLRVYRNGVDFTVSARSRGALARRHELYAALSGHHPRGRQATVEQFLLGFEFSDRRSVTNIGNWPPDTDPDSEGPWLSPGSGSGSGGSADCSFYLAPLPPPGTLTLVAAWPSFGLAESRHHLDASAIKAAALDVLELWPVEPVDNSSPEPPPPPDLPPGSWFQRN